MARAPKFATGKYANAMCDICAIRCKYTELKPTFVRGRKTGLLACPTCWDPDHPQNFLDTFVTTDPMALRNPRPDTGAAASRRLFPPLNWLDGGPPTLQDQECMIEAQAQAARESKEDSEEQQERWRWANQKYQRRFLPGECP